MTDMSLLWEILQARSKIDNTPLPAGYPFMDFSEIEHRMVDMMVSTECVGSTNILDDEWHPSLMPWVEQLRLKRYAQKIMNRTFGGNWDE